ncbi:MAG: TetR family transcriptional regulator [Gammaproteobacteria bacterium]|nr:TetR family transcriptional regulator [Gammaproteobacteria bacterium]
MSESQERLPRKTQKRSLKTRQRLLDAALEAFSESGYKGTSTRDIAARAGVHHPLITYHFSNKDRLWRSAVKYVFSDFIVALRDAEERLAEACPKSRFAAMIRVYVQYAARHPALHKIVLQESGEPSDRLDWLSENFLSPLAEAASRYIGELQKLGVVPAGDPLILYNMIRVSSGTLIALALELKTTSGINFEDPARLDELSDLIVRVFLPGEVAAG